MFPALFLLLVPHFCGSLRQFLGTLPVGLLAEENPHLGVLLKEADHFGKVGPARLLGGLYVGELPHDFVVLPAGVGAHELALGGDGVAFPLLLLGGDSCVEDGFSGKKGVRLHLSSSLDFQCLRPAYRPWQAELFKSAAHGRAARSSPLNPSYKIGRAKAPKPV
ncbi:hypothetical protein ES708_02670 [subsurface metagenome]